MPLPEHLYFDISVKIEAISRKPEELLSVTDRAELANFNGQLAVLAGTVKQDIAKTLRGQESCRTM